MAKLTLIHRDMTAVAPSDMHHPEWVQAFEQLGFRVVGRASAVPDPGGIDALVDGYADTYQRQVRDAEQLPAVVLAAPDSSAYAEVHWFWDGPSVRLRTVTAYGQLVETHLAWRQVPPWPLKADGIVRHLDVRSEQVLAACRGRDIVALPDADAAALWAAHQARVGGTAPLAHDSIAGHLRLATRAFEHASRVVERNRRLTHAVLVLSQPLVCLVVWAIGVPPLGLMFLVLVVVLEVVFLAAWNPLQVWIRYRSWLRPAFQ